MAWAEYSNTAHTTQLAGQKVTSGLVQKEPTKWLSSTDHINRYLEIYYNAVLRIDCTPHLLQVNKKKKSKKKIFTPSC